MLERKRGGDSNKALRQEYDKGLPRSMVALHYSGSSASLPLVRIQVHQPRGQAELIISQSITKSWLYG